VCENLNINHDDLFSATRDHRTSQKRMILTHFWLNYSNLTLTAIAKKFCRTHATIRRQYIQWQHHHFPDELPKYSVSAI